MSPPPLPETLFRFNCPFCKRSIKAPQSLRGQQVACPKCKSQFRVTLPEVTVGPEAATAAPVVTTRFDDAAHSPSAPPPLPGSLDVAGSLPIASRRKRILATAIDILAVCAMAELMYLVGFILMIPLLYMSGMWPIIAGIFQQDWIGALIGAMTLGFWAGLDPTGTAIELLILVQLPYMALTCAILYAIWYYCCALVAGPWQATPGKRYCKLKVVTTTGGRLTRLQATQRTAIKVLSLVPFGLGIVPLLLSPTRQALHVRLVKTIVVEDHRKLGETRGRDS